MFFKRLLFPKPVFFQYTRGPPYDIPENFKSISQGKFVKNCVRINVLDIDEYYNTNV